MPPLRYNPALDGLRALAITTVVVMHSGATGVVGADGVTVFFVLSGYLITTLLVAEFDTHGTIARSGFYRRRLARLAPGLVVAVVGSVLWLVATRTPTEYWWAGPVGALTYSMDLIQARWGNAHVGISFQYTWSLGLEEQFYLLWPILLLSGLRRARPRQLMGALVACIAVDWCLKARQNSGSPRPELQAFGPVSHSDALLLGCLVAIVLARARPQTYIRIGRSGAVLGPLALGALVLLSCCPDSPGFGVGNSVTIALLAAVVVGWLASTPPRHGPALLGVSPLRFLGKMSYQIYLWNIPILVIWERWTHQLPWTEPWADRIAFFTEVLCWSCLTYALVEAPLRRMLARRRSPRGSSRPAARRGRSPAHMPSGQ